MRARIDMTEVETRTKIRAKYLRAIENEEWDLLPGPVYVRSFLRTYSDFLGLDSRMLIEEFKRQYEHPGDPDPRPMTSLARERERRSRRPTRIPPWVPIGAVVVVVVVVLFVVGLATQPGTTTTSTHRTPPARGRAGSKNHAAPALPAAPAPPAVATLQLVPTGTVYVCLVNGRGAKLINERTFTTGEAIPTAHARRLLLTLGNASVSMKVDGRAVPVAPSANPIRLLVTPSGVSHIPLSQTPTCP